ncbi:MAG: PepSY-associated TM helix domain-containing protein [Janthinobacterium lividum]
MSSTLTGPRTASVASRPVAPSARLIFRTLHLVVGLSFGLLLVLQGLSGSALVWRPELDRLMLPALSHVPLSAPPSDAGIGLDPGYAAVQAAAPHDLVRMVRLPATGDGTDEWIVQLPTRPGEAGEGPRWTMYTNPSTGQLLGIRGQRRDALEWLIELHHNLLWGRTGRAIQGYLAIATILLSLSGLWLWWPARWTWSRFRPRAAAKPLHYAIGFWTMGPLLVIATTAIYFVWRQPIQKAFGIAETRRVGAGTAGSPDGMSSNRDENGRHTPQGKDGGETLVSNPPSPGGAHRRNQGSQSMKDAYPLRDHSGGNELALIAPRSVQNPPLHPAPMKFDAVMRAVHAAQPDARFTAIRMPEGGRGLYTVLFESRSEHYRAAPNSMLVRVGADGTAQVDRTIWWRDLPRRRRFLEWLPRIHQGEFGGVTIRLLWTLTGLCPAVLFTSGFFMWRRRLHVSG